jgi:hypothetical protein
MKRQPKRNVLAVSDVMSRLNNIKLCSLISIPRHGFKFRPRAKLRASSKAPSPPASGSRNVHNQATNFSVLKRDPHAFVLHVFKDLNCYFYLKMRSPHTPCAAKLGRQRASIIWFFDNYQFYLYTETFEKCPILVKVKEGENFNHRNILNISRIKI